MVENLNSRVWTPWPAKFLYGKGVVTCMRGFSVGKREDNCKQILREWIYESCYYTLCLEISRFDSRLNSEKILNGSVQKKCLVKCFNRSKIRPFKCSLTHPVSCLIAPSKALTQNLRVREWSQAARQMSNPRDLPCTDIFKNWHLSNLPALPWLQFGPVKPDVRQTVV